MAHIVSSHAEVAGRIQPGDVIAFSGDGAVSATIKKVTRSIVSHVGIVIEPATDGSPRVIESTDAGVNIDRLDKRLEVYEGHVYWLPLSAAVRAKVDLSRLKGFLKEQVGKGYDLPQAVLAGLDALDDAIGELTKNTEDFSKFFCSELVAAGLEASGAIPAVNASEITPVDVFRLKIYDADYYQLKGKKRGLKGYNTRAPGKWCKA